MIKRLRLGAVRDLAFVFDRVVAPERRAHQPGECQTWSGLLGVASRRLDLCVRGYWRSASAVQGTASGREDATERSDPGSCRAFARSSEPGARASPSLAGR